MKYLSTRGGAPAVGFADALLAGLAPDGGLYVPEAWPRLSADEIARMAGRPYADIAADIIARFTGDDLDRDRLRTLCAAAYGAFRHPAVAPLIQLDANAWILELFHGPTYAFKDLAMQLLARLMDDALAARRHRVTIVAATSGDTGGSAIEAFRGSENVDLFVLFPKGRVSPVQRRQMTTATERNIHPIAVEGSFDDCQALVKGLFANARLRRQVSLAAVNSINWARIVAQTVYYFTSAVALGGPFRPVSFCVPTGNFGDVYAGHVAARMGLPIGRLVIATNSNDILARALETGRYETRAVIPTMSPSMDIQVASNFERLLWEAYGRDGDGVRGAMDRLKQGGGFDIKADALALIRKDFSAGRADELEAASAMAQTLEASGYLADPHTSVALAVGRRAAQDGPLVTLATAHPAKFPDAVEAATGRRPAMPEPLAALEEREERFVVLGNDLAGIERYVEKNARAATQEA